MVKFGTTCPSRIRWALTEGSDRARAIHAINEDKARERLDAFPLVLLME
jgi:hypothetical protein